MITIQGTPLKGGTVIAVGAVVTSLDGTNSVSPSLLKRGVDAVIRRLPEQEMPHAILVCDTLKAAQNASIAGISLVGMVAQEDGASDQCDLDGPCVVNLPGLLTSVREDDIIIIDGTTGIVYIDPDVQTLYGYQQVHEDFIPRSRLRITGSHVGAKTADGVSIMVYAFVSSVTELDEALDQGADGIYLTGHDESEYDVFFSTVAGLPTLIASPTDFDSLLGAAATYCVPHQLTALFPQELEQEAELLRAAIDFFPMRFPDMPELPEIACGIVVGEIELDSDAMPEPPVVAVDFSVGAAVLNTLAARDGIGRLVVTCLDTKPDVKALVQSGARCVAVRHNLVGQVKTSIRTVRAEADG